MKTFSPLGIKVYFKGQKFKHKAINGASYMYFEKEVDPKCAKDIWYLLEKNFRWIIQNGECNKTMSNTYHISGIA